MDEESFEAELQKQLVYWQRMLYLQDWTIDLKIVRQWEMPDSTTIACCEWYIQRKDAFIKVLHHSDLGGVTNLFIRGEECDYDISLVHELLHLHFAVFKHEEDTIAIEQAINAISRGMVKAWREVDTEHQPSLCFKHSVASEGYL